jgi:alkaline phosphatase
MDVALRFAEQDGHTLIVITSDHKIGGLTFSESDHAYIATFLGQVTASAEHIGSQMMDEDRVNVQHVIRQYTPIDHLTSSEIQIGAGQHH